MVVDGLDFSQDVLVLTWVRACCEYCVMSLFVVMLPREGKWRLEQVFRFWCEWYEGAFPRLKVADVMWETFCVLIASLGFCTCGY